MLENADQKAGNDIDSCNENAGDGITLRKPRSSVHGSKKFCFFGQIASANPGLFLIDQTRTQVRVNRHLFSGQGIQCESGRDFRYADRAVVNDDVLNRNQHEKNNHADYVVSPDYKVSESLNDFSGCGGTRVAVHQDQTCRGDIQREPKQRKQEQRCGEDTELNRFLDMHRDHQHDD